MEWPVCYTTGRYRVTLVSVDPGRAASFDYGCGPGVGVLGVGRGEKPRVEGPGAGGLEPGADDEDLCLPRTAPPRVGQGAQSG
ncbi:Hypothetical protein NTJ_14226 [Nesidiocoris tenuis]|uniref:PKD domain-containing protein n=1 Tax=Nesidiocoris tenuis TaxID=355587 RepID=A0ABN7BAJ0_9HEMI|nr:Hypothetical protein NTJ_14226 [Nesidiocoris tenuis]